jgi:hypothetical protein
MQFNKKKMHWKIISRNPMKKEDNLRILLSITDLMMAKETMLMTFLITAIRLCFQAWLPGGFLRKNRWKLKINGAKNVHLNMQLAVLSKGKKE